MKKILSIILGCVLVTIVGASAYAVGTRQATGVDQSLRFEAGTAVSGDTIKLDSGQTYRDCYFASTPTAGTVTSGAVWPWEGEIGTKSCETAGKANPTPEVVDKRQATGVNSSLRFEQNTPVLGNIIKLDTGKTYTNCYFPMAPAAGSVTTGAIFPWEGETSGLTMCFSQDNNNQNRNQPTITTTPTPTPTITLRPGQPTSTPTPTPVEMQKRSGRVWVDYNKNSIFDCANNICDQGLANVKVYTLATYSDSKFCSNSAHATFSTTTQRDGRYIIEFPERYIDENGRGGSLCVNSPHIETPAGYVLNEQQYSIEKDLYDFLLVPQATPTPTTQPQR